MSSIDTEYEAAQAVLLSKPAAQPILNMLEKTVTQQLQPQLALARAMVGESAVGEMVHKNLTLLLARLLGQVRQLDRRSLEEKLSFIVQLFVTLSSAAQEWGQEVARFEPALHDKKARRRRRHQPHGGVEVDLRPSLLNALASLQTILLPHGADSIYMPAGAAMMAPALFSLIESNRPQAAEWISTTVFSRETKNTLFSRWLLKVREWARSPEGLAMPSLQFDETLLLPFEQALGPFFHTFLEPSAPWIQAVSKRPLAIKALSVIAFQLYATSLEDLFLSFLSSAMEGAFQPFESDALYTILDDESFFTALLSKCLPQPQIKTGGSILDTLRTGLEAAVTHNMADSASVPVREAGSYFLVRLKNFILSGHFDQALFHS